MNIWRQEVSCQVPLITLMMTLIDGDYDKNDYTEDDNDDDYDKNYDIEDDSNDECDNRK